MENRKSPLFSIFSSRRLLLTLIFTIGSLTLAHAKGRRPAADEEDTDQFPDYNRLEMRPKPKTTETPAPAAPEKQAVPPPTRSLNAPANPVADEESPRPPPEVVPLPTGGSEPPMPDEIMDTIGTSTTSQK